MGAPRKDARTRSSAELSTSVQNYVQNLHHAAHGMAASSYPEDYPQLVTLLSPDAVVSRSSWAVNRRPP